MSPSQGRFVWHDLMTTDPSAATAFYCSVIGWNTRPAPPPNERYTVLEAGETGIGGIGALPQAAIDNGARPRWQGYITVDDVDATAAHAVEAGATLHHAGDIPNVGRFANLVDPQGAPFVLFRPMGEGMQPPPGSTPGHVGWNELHARDWEAAFAFYAGLFGWTKSQTVDMGPMGTYQLFAIDGVDAGGMWNSPAAQGKGFWLYYVNVPEIEAAIARAKDAGGTLLHGPQEVPGGSLIAQFTDPEGVMFAMVAPPAAPA